jgi:hypothetical protein
MDQSSPPNDVFEDEKEEDENTDIKIEGGSMSDRGAVGISKEFVDKYLAHNERPLSEEEQKRVKELQERGNSVTDQRLSIPAERQQDIQIMTSQGYAVYYPVKSAQQLIDSQSESSNLIVIFNRNEWLKDPVNRDWWNQHRALFLFEATDKIIKKSGSQNVVTKMLLTIPYLNRLMITPRLLQLFTGNNGKYVMDTYDVLCHYHALLLASFSERKEIKKLKEYIISRYIEPKLQSGTLTKEMLLDNLVFDDNGESVKQLNLPITSSTDMKEVYSHLIDIQKSVDQSDIIGNVDTRLIMEHHLNKLYDLRMEATDGAWERLFSYTNQQEGNPTAIEGIGDIENNSLPTSDKIPTDAEKKLWTLILYQYELIWTYEMAIMDVLGMPQHGGRKEAILARRAKANPSFLSEEDKTNFLKNRIRLRQCRLKYMNKPEDIMEYEFTVDPSLEITEQEIDELIEFLKYYNNKLNSSDDNNNEGQSLDQVIDSLYKITIESDV